MFGETLPELPPTETIADMWRELGMARASPHGPAVFEWAEIAAFAQYGGYAITPIEAGCLVDMSRAYVTNWLDTNPFSIAPMERGDD